MTDWISETLYSNGTLKNKLHIHNAQKLSNIEYLRTTIKSIILLDQKPKTTSIKDLGKIHKFMFSDLYDWAGKYRKGNFQKNGYTFFDYQRFNFAEEDIDNLLQRLHKKGALTNYDYAELLDKINFMHPFREGNGRSAKLFLDCLSGNHAQVIAYPRENDEMIEAQNAADIEAIANLVIVQNSLSREAAFKLLREKQKKQYQECRTRQGKD